MRALARFGLAREIGNNCGIHHLDIKGLSVVGGVVRYKLRKRVPRRRGKIAG
jgi:hypothetical protein